MSMATLDAVYNDLLNNRGTFPLITSPTILSKIFRAVCGSYNIVTLIEVSSLFRRD